MDLGFIISIGLIGSLHCVGMCGGIACAYSIPVSRQGMGRLWKFHGLYVLGRLLAYGWIGALMGLLGMGMAGTFAPDSQLRDVGAMLGAAVLIIGGVATLIGHQWPEWISGGISKVAFPFSGRFREWAKLDRPWKVAPLGMLSGILPCGLMWAVEIRAFSTNSWFLGMLMMLVFCLVTTPSLLLTGTLMSRANPFLKRHAVRLSGLIVLLMGIYLIWSHFLINPEDNPLRCDLVMPLN